MKQLSSGILITEASDPKPSRPDCDLYPMPATLPSPVFKERDRCPFWEVLDEVLEDLNRRDRPQDRVSLIPEDYEPGMFWRDLSFGSYNNEIDWLLYMVARHIHQARKFDSQFYTTIELGNRLRVPDSYIELLMTILGHWRWNDKDGFEYGVSPRGTFVGDIDAVEVLLACLEAELGLIELPAHIQARQR